MMWKGYPWGVSLLLTVLIGNASYGLGETAAQYPEQDATHCYGLAMVGMDSVINSRLGIPPEHILPLATIDPDAAITLADELHSAATYSIRLLKIIFEAYLWQDTPQEYAAQVLDTCAA